MDHLLLSVGSNEDAPGNIRRAVSALRECFGFVQCSTVYESEAIGFIGDNFLNLVVMVNSDLRVGELLEKLKHLENAQGRDRNSPRFSGRTLDIDILIYGERHGSFDGVCLPRPEITENAYVLWPLSELLPQHIHPGENKSYLQLWQDYDHDKQKLWAVDFEWN